MFSPRTVELVQAAVQGTFVPSSCPVKPAPKSEFDRKKTAEAKDDLAILYGHAPHDSWSNHCYSDGYYANSLERKWGMSTSDLAKAINYSGSGRPFYDSWD